MWLVTNFGFFSVVQKPDDKGAGTLTIRARVKADLLAFRDRHLPELGPIQANAGTDYKYRAKAPREAVARAVAEAVLDIDYSNFKNSVAQRQGYERAHVYGNVWDDLFQLQEPAAPAPMVDAEEPCFPGCSYGGVLVDDRGRVLLREPAGHFDGYVWTFAKGRGAPGENQVEVALREVREETGYEANVVARIPGVFKGGTGDNIYFLMRPVGKPAPFDPETQAIRWVTPDEARQLIAQTTNSVGRKRDLAILEATLTLLADGPK